MNRVQRSTYGNLSKRVQRRMEVLFIPSVYKALRSQIKFFTRLARENGVQYAINRMPLMSDQVATVIRNIHLKAGLFAARETRKNILREVSLRVRAANSKGLTEVKLEGRPPLESSAGNKNYGINTENHLVDKTHAIRMQEKRTGFGFNERMTRDIQEYFRLHLLEKAVVPISATLKKRIETVLSKAAAEGWGVDRIIQELEGERFREMTRNHARKIVRTETVRAMNYGAMAAANDSEFEQEKIWIAVNDPRTRTTHKHGTGVDGERRDLLSPFSNGLMFPGDPNGPASEVIQCRCTMAFRAKRDASGRLVPKKREGILVSLASRLTGLYRRIAALIGSLT